MSDLQAAMATAGWTAPQVSSRLALLTDWDVPQRQTNASIIVASFLLTTGVGMRFNTPDLGAWYAGETPETAGREVGHHLFAEAEKMSWPSTERAYFLYGGNLGGDYVDIRGQQATDRDLYNPDDYSQSQLFGATVRSSSQAGIIWDSIRHPGQANVVCYRPGLITNVAQTGHFNITVTVSPYTIAMTPVP
jgi:hypothetical protein